MESIIQFKFCGHMGNQSQQWLHGAYNPSSDNLVGKYINHLLSCSYNLFPANFKTKCRGYGHF